MLQAFDALHDLAEPLADGSASEAQWLQQAAQTRSSGAWLWTSQPALVVPRSYERAPNWAAACAASAAAGYPVQVRASGGGLVPQGPGVLNLSLVWPSDAAQPTQIEAVYRALCASIAAALATLGVHAAPQSVEGSFCDGRYNLAVDGAKLVGTAQSWRLIAGAPVVLAHAVIVVEADPRALTERCNGFERALGHQRRYRAQAVTSVAQAWVRAHIGEPLPPDLEQRLRRAIRERLRPHAASH